ncbi:transglutaminase TgpA family protein [Symbiobacterium thermophilum]|nr:DUF3488 and transglutaminase-like domain-containing protein [Symbiobacterium thermophilum]
MATARPSAGYQLALLTFSAGLVALSLHSLNQFWRMEMPAEQILLVTLASVLWGWLWWRSRPAGLLSAAGLALGALIAARKMPAVGRWAIRAAQEGIFLVRELAEGNLGASFGPAVGVVLMVLAGVGAGLVVTGEALQRGRAFWAIALGFLLFGTQWAWYFDPALNYFHAYVVLALLLWVLAQAALRDARWRAEARHLVRRSSLAAPMAGVLSVAMLAAVLPGDFKPLSLGTLGQQLQSAIPSLEQFRGGGVASGGDFTLAVTGFSPEIGRLGGAVTLDDRVALRIAVSGPLSQALYVRGAVFLTYTGATWEPGDSPAVAPQDGLLPSQMGEETLRRAFVAEITPVFGFGRTIFHVLEPARVDGLARYTADAEGNLRSAAPILPGVTYAVTARLPLYSAAQIRETPRFDPRGPDTPEMARYLQLPELPERVHRLAREIAAGQEHAYDQAVAIESYLRRMRYTLTPPATPQGRDFVDYFLFDLQEGYCTYYASAMVVMLRSLGIPARFVEGYAIPASAPFTVDDRGWRTYEARNSQAHAWVEAYFPGYGWVTFDPTPRADLPVISRNASLGSPGLDDPGLTDEFEPGNDTLPQAPRAEQEVPEAPDFSGMTPGDARRPRTWWALAAIAAAGLALLAARVLGLQERFRYADARSVVQEAWEKTAWLLGRFGLGRQPYQTPLEYAEQVAAALPSLGQEARQAAADYTAARYGPPDDPVPAEHAQRARAFWQRAKEALAEEYGWRVYLRRRLVGRRGGRP